MSDRDPRGEARTLERLLMIGAVGLITCLAFETLATTNAMPTIVATLGSDRWYSLTVGVVLAGQILSTVVTGWVSDRFGVRLPLLTGVLGFALGATIAGLAPNLALFIIGRAVQGLGSGMVIVPLMVLIGAIVDPKRRPTFFAAFSFAWVIPSMSRTNSVGLHRRPLALARDFPHHRPTRTGDIHPIDADTLRGTTH